MMHLEAKVLRKKLNIGEASDIQDWPTYKASTTTKW